MTTVDTPASLASCARCHCTTTVPELLRPTARSFRGAGKPICPRCALREQLTTLYVMGGVYVGAAMLLLGVWFFKDLPPRERQEMVRFVSVLAALVLTGPVMIIVHEGGHALVGWAVGLRIFGVSLGSGPRLWRWRLSRFFLDIHVFPIRGVCWSGAEAERSNRWRLVMMVAAGPMVHVLAIAVLLAAVRPAGFGFIDEWPFIQVWSAVLWVNVFMLIGNLVPRQIQRDGIIIRSDGKRLLNMLSSKHDDTEWIISRYSMETGVCIEAGRIEEARRWLELARPLAGQTPAFRVTELGVLGHEGRWPMVLAKATEQLSDSADALERYGRAANPLSRYVWACWAAVAYVYTCGDLSLAEALSAEVKGMGPWDPAVMTVCATVFLAQGRDGEAEAMLKQAGSMKGQWSARAAAAHLWAELYRRRGDEGRRVKWERRARAMDPSGALRMPGRGGG